MRQMRPLRTVALLLLAAGTASRPARAQEDAPAGELAASLSSVRPGTVLRVQSDGGGLLEGLLIRVEADALVMAVAGAEQRVPAAGVEAVWARGRQTRRGAAIGAAVAGTAALLYGAFFGLLVAGEGGTSGEVAKVALGSGALGVAGGGLAGGVIGSTVTRWYRVYPAGNAGPRLGAPPPVSAQEADPVERGPVEPRRLGSAEVAAGYARSPQDGGTDGGLAGRVALVAEFPRGEHGFLGVGLEAGRQSLGGTGIRRAADVRQVCDPECEYRIDSVSVRRRYRVSDVGGVLRAGWARHGVEPFAVLGLGTQLRQTDVLPVDGTRGAGSSTRVGAGYSVGAGGRLRRPGAPWTVGVEGRWHSNLLAGQSDGIDEAFGFWTVGATLNRRW